MNLSQIIERKKEEFEWIGNGWFWNKDEEYIDGGNMDYCWNFIEKAIRESVEESLREVRPEGHVEEEVGFNDCLKDYNQRVEEFMK